MLERGSLVPKGRMFVFVCLQGSISDSSQKAARALYVVCYMQSLGYFINLKKSQLQPVSWMMHLGLGFFFSSDSLSFWITDKKKCSFAHVREDMLKAGSVLLKKMQHFVGKCQASF